MNSSESNLLVKGRNRGWNERTFHIFCFDASVLVVRQAAGMSLWQSMLKSCDLGAEQTTREENHNLLANKV